SGDSHIMEKEVADSLDTDAQTEGEAIKESDIEKESENNNKDEIDDDNDETSTRSASVRNETKKEKGFLYKVFGKFTKSKN
ncbi:MAG: hypothetical protein PHE19_01700, partial [Candidatus Cloacimonetes bacterium]|nr:hypothetical protein [Candidatus Cloacimonadota bacterium]